MDLKEAIERIKEDKSIILEAKALVDLHCPDADFAWLYKETGGNTARYREISIDGRRYPTKAFGFLVSQLAGNTQTKIGDSSCPTDKVASALEYHGYPDISRKSGGAPEPEQGPQQEDQIAISYYQVLARPNQATFRRILLQKYNGRCAVTGNKVEGCLEAAHVKPVSLSGKDTSDNGILLRSDIHKLFDRHEMAIDPVSFTAYFSEKCLAYYKVYQGVSILRYPDGPSPDALNDRWEIFCAKND